MGKRDEHVISQLRRELQPGRLSQLWSRGREKLAASAGADRAADVFKAGLARVSVLCPRCSHAIHRESLGQGERVFWCPHCAQVQNVPLFRIPGWIAGTMLVLVAKLHFGI